VFLSLSKASKSTDEAHPFPTVPFAQNHAASFIGPGCQFGYALDPKAGNPKLKPVMGAFAMPSHTPGKTMPAFLGGSDLAIPATSQNKDLAEDWIADFTSNASMAGIVKAGNLPNTTSLLKLVKGTPGAQLAQAARTTWFVPTAKNWTNVESANVLQNMLTQILTGKKSVKDAAASASNQITTTLNSST
jgi:N,N'-diacetylchitobiose transport system substrate-binding protein